MPRPRKARTVDISKTAKPGFRFVATVYGPAGGRERRYFRTRQAAEDLRTLKMMEWAAPEYHLEITDAEKEAVRIARKAGIDLREAVRRATDAAAHVAKSSGHTMREAGEKWLESLERSGRSKRHTMGLKNFLDRIMADAGGVPVHAVTPEWIGGVVHREGSFAASTRGSYRRMLHSLFAFAVEHGMRPDNPVSRVKAPKVSAHADDIRILSLEECRALMAAVAEFAPGIMPAFAIGLFAGLRTAEIRRLAWEDVRIDRDVIIVAASKSKTGTRRMVAVQPALRALLEPRAATGPIWPTNGAKQWDKALKAAGWRGHAHWGAPANKHAPVWPPNALRHSFVSYHVAGFQDSAKTALEAGHSQTMLFRHYRQLVTEDEAVEFWTMGLLE